MTAAILKPGQPIGAGHRLSHLCPCRVPLEFYTTSLVSLAATLRDTSRNAVQLADDGADAMASGQVNQAIETILLLHRSGDGGTS